MINIIISCLRKIINKNILFTSRDKIVDYSLVSKELVDSNTLKEDMVNIIENRKDIVNYLYNDLIYNIYPIIINGDLYGSIIVYSNNEVTDKDIYYINFCKKFLENYLE